MSDIIDAIINLREHINCFDYAKSEYMITVKGLIYEGCEYHEDLSDPEDIEEFLDRHLDSKNKLITHVFGIMSLIEHLDSELRKQRESDDL